MKKLLTLLITLLLSFVLVACGSDEDKVSDSEKPQENVDVVEEEAVEEEEVAQEEETASEDVQEDENFRAVNTYTNKELGITGTVGPIEYEFSGIQLKQIEIKSCWFF